ncbi:MAG: hypothetical protein MUO82_10750 [Candidatus Thermoplasmatota archaeon]|nr:hypothetical protein [Candidatus Thermoplasmatota archaeon]
MIEIYATTDNGHGFCESIGIYNSFEEIKIRTGMFSKDIVITFVEVNKKYD